MPGFVWPGSLPFVALHGAREKGAQHTSTPLPLLQALLSAPGWDEIRESRFYHPIRGHLLPQSGVQGSWGRPGCRAPAGSVGQAKVPGTPPWWPLSAGSAQVCAPVPAGPRAAGAAEVHGDRGLLELRHLGLRVHHRLPAFPAQLAAGAVVSEPRARPPGGCPPPLPDAASSSWSRGAPQAGPETPVTCDPKEVLLGPGVSTA